MGWAGLGLFSPVCRGPARLGTHAVPGALVWVWQCGAPSVGALPVPTHGGCARRARCVGKKPGKMRFFLRSGLF